MLPHCHRNKSSGLLWPIQSYNIMFIYHYFAVRVLDTWKVTAAARKKSKGTEYEETNACDSHGRTSFVIVYSKA